VVLPGARVPATATNTVTYTDGAVLGMPEADGAGVTLPA